MLFAGFLLAWLLACTPAALAMQVLDDAELGELTAADGLEISYTHNTTSIASLTWDVDAGVTSVGGVAVTPEAYARAESLFLRPVDTAGNLLGTQATSTFSLDVGASAVSGGVPTAALRLAWPRLRFQIGDFRHELAPLVSGVSPSTGTLALDFSGELLLRANNGLVNSVSGNADFSLDVQDASLFFRQGAVGSPELLFDNLSFRPRFTGGGIGFDNSGFLLVAPNLDFDLTFDLRYDDSPSAGFTYVAADDRPMLYYGWQGRLNNVQLRVRPGGVWYGTTGSPAVYNTANRSQGLNFTARWDYDPAFAWVVGESRTSGSGAPRAQVQFDQWQKIGSGYAFDVQNNTLDVIRAGQGPGGLCWGTTVSVAGPSATCTSASYSDATYYPRPEYLEIVPENGMALLARDARQMAYSTRVVILDDFNNDGDYADTASGITNVANGTTETQNVQWGLIYTLGDFDANIYLYPGGYDFVANTPTATGLKLDFLLMTQSHDAGDAGLAPDWATGSHYMIADTAPGVNFGIGFMNAAVLLAADDMYVSLLPTGMNFRTHPVTGKARVQFKGRFGGGDVPNMTAPVNGFDINANFESTSFNFTLEPPAVGQNYLGFSGTVDVGDTDIAGFSESTAVDGSDDGTFISLSEPGRPTVDVRLANISGRLQWVGGRIDLVSDSEVANQTAKLEIASSLNLGTTASGAALTIGRVEFGNQALGTVVAPSGTWYAGVALKRQ